MTDKPYNEAWHVYHVMHLGDYTKFRVQFHKLRVVLNYHLLQAANCILQDLRSKQYIHHLKNILDTFVLFVLMLLVRFEHTTY